MQGIFLPEGQMLNLARFFLTSPVPKIWNSSVDILKNFTRRARVEKVSKFTLSLIEKIASTTQVGSIFGGEGQMLLVSFLGEKKEPPLLSSHLFYDFFSWPNFSQRSLSL